MLAYKSYECTYIFNGKVNKDGDNKGKEFQICQFREMQEHNQKGVEGSYTYTCFVWASDYHFEIGETYNLMIQPNNKRSNDSLVSVEG